MSAAAHFFKMVSARFALVVVLLAVSLYAFRAWMKGASCSSTQRLDGKVVIVTGANTGIGKETARDMVKRGAKVYMACRTMERGEAAAADIRQSTGASASQVTVLKLDLTSFKSVRLFAEDFHKREKQLDILINNAGIMFAPYSITEDGYESTFQSNHLGHFLLTNLLLDLLQASAPSRVVTVSSMGAYIFSSGMEFDNLMVSEKEYSSTKAYSQSKQANILFSQELATRLKGTGVTTYSLHPGSIFTDLGRHVFFYDYAIVRETLRFLFTTFMKDAVDGAQTTICCAVDSKLGQETGKYYQECAEYDLPETARNEEEAKKLWEMSEEFVGLRKAK